MPKLPDPVEKMAKAVIDKHLEALDQDMVDFYVTEVLLVDTPDLFWDRTLTTFSEEVLKRVEDAKVMVKFRG